MTTTAHRTISEIEADLKQAASKVNHFRKVINEGQGGYVDESSVEDLTQELHAALAACSPLTLDLAGERAWFNGQKFTGKDLAAANKACLSRGYSLAELQAANKASKASK
jgi:hypothetical protein